jgi:hypothetical protein
MSDRPISFPKATHFDDLFESYAMIASWWYRNLKMESKAMQWDQVAQLAMERVPK